MEMAFKWEITATDDTHAILSEVHVRSEDIRAGSVLQGHGYFECEEKWGEESKTHQSLAKEILL